MNKRRDVISIVSLLIVTMFVIIVYLQFYYLDLSKYQYNMKNASKESPDGTYLIELYTVGENKESAGEINETYYAYGRLFYNPTTNADGTKNWSKEQSQIIYYEKGSKEGLLDWIDNKTAIINGVTLDVTKEKYDYRRKLVSLT